MGGREGNIEDAFMTLLSALEGLDLEQSVALLADLCLVLSHRLESGDDLRELVQAAQHRCGIVTSVLGAG